ncbi:MAG: DUF885 domain-containing protein [Candidatus Acidiferrales bacterium]
MQARVYFLFLSGLFLLALPRHAEGQRSTAKNSRSHNEDKRLRDFFATDWKYWMVQYPEFATSIGYAGRNRRWTDDSPEAIAARNVHLLQSVKALDQIDREKLSAIEKLNFDLYRKLLANAIEGLRFHNDAMPFASVVAHNLYQPINQREGLAQDIGQIISDMPAENVSDYEDILARLNSLPLVVDQTIALMQEGLKHGDTPPKITLTGVPKQFEDQVFRDPMESPLLRAFLKFPERMPPAEQERLRKAAATAYSEKVVPAFRKIHDYLASTYIPVCRESIAMSALPDGAAHYAYNVKWQTTTELTPQQIHAIGLSEVKRIRGEMDQVIRKSGFNGTFSEFAAFLRTDPRFYFSDASSLVTEYRDIAKRVDPQLTHLFGKLPRLTYGVLPVPDYLAPTQTTAYYQPGSPAAARPGNFMVNTYALDQRPKWEMEALTLHEAVPGHHLQIALAQELEGVPEFRKHVGYTAFVEGWALYSESLGGEMGFYTDPYSKFGQLTYEMWRAVRLVVDTGMHSMGWTREQAIQFFAENTSKTGHDIEVEVDRYIVWPGQALGYKIGEMKIKELRELATKELGDKFSERAFHDAVLDNGAVPLDVLEAQIKEWIADQKQR